MFLANRLRAAAGRARIPTDGLIAHYTMDNISGSTLVDEMGNYDGTLVNSPAFTPGIIGNAIDFDGNSGYAGSFGMTGVLLDAFSFWIYAPEEITSATATAYHFGTLSTLAGYAAIGPASSAYNDETLSFLFFGATLSDRSFYYIKDTLPLGWNHVVFNWDGSTYKISLNGTERTTFHHTEGTGEPSGRVDLEYLTLGKRYNYEQHSTLQLDQARIYSNSGLGLDASEISALYNEGA